MVGQYSLAGLLHSEHLSAAALADLHRAQGRVPQADAEILLHRAPRDDLHQREGRHIRGGKHGSVVVSVRMHPPPAVCARVCVRAQPLVSARSGRAAITRLQGGSRLTSARLTSSLMKRPFALAQTSMTFAKVGATPIIICRCGRVRQPACQVATGRQLRGRVACHRTTANRAWQRSAAHLAGRHDDAGRHHHGRARGHRVGNRARGAHRIGRRRVARSHAIGGIHGGGLHRLRACWQGGKVNESFASHRVELLARGDASGGSQCQAVVVAALARFLGGQGSGPSHEPCGTRGPLSDGALGAVRWCFAIRWRFRGHSSSVVGRRARAPDDSVGIAAAASAAAATTRKRMSASAGDHMHGCTSQRHAAGSPASCCCKC